jgi:hypothetical protein
MRTPTSGIIPLNIEIGDFDRAERSHEITPGEVNTAERLRELPEVRRNHQQ